MANIIKIKRGLEANLGNLTLLPGELGVTLDTHKLYVGDANGVKQLIKGAAAGVVEAADKLSTERAIAISGDATGSTLFDGSKDATIALSLATSGVTAGTYNNVTVNAKGIVTSASNVVYKIEDIQGLQTALNAKANADEVYKKTETYSSTEIDNKINAKDSLPSQENNAGKFLTTDGTVASWATVDLSSKADLEDFNELANTVAAKANSKDVYTKTEMDTAFETIGTELDSKANADDVYTAAEVNNLLNSKEDKGTAYTKTEVDALINAKANSATTLSGYGITDAYTQGQTDTLLSAKANASDMETALAGKAAVSSVETLEETLTGEINKKADKATTLSGYGIENAYTKTEVDGMVAGTFHFRGEKDSYDSLPTDAKEGDVYQVADKEYAWDGDSWVELGFNMDLSAYATTADVAKDYATKSELSSGLGAKANSADVYTKTQIDTEISTLNTNINAKANSADVYTKTDADALLANKAAKATTLSGYGITDAYTKNETGELLANKADKATTLAGYSISDAYTKTEINNEITTLNNKINVKLDANSVIDGGEFGAEA
jgi:phage-related tail fiber protein